MAAYSPDLKVTYSDFKGTYGTRIQWTLPSGATPYMDVHGNPTHNCQIAILGGIQAALGILHPKNIIEGMGPKLYSPNGFYGKNLILVDISEHYIEAANNLFGTPHSLHKFPSTNGSNRILVLYKSNIIQEEYRKILAEQKTKEKEKLFCV